MSSPRFTIFICAVFLISVSKSFSQTSNEGIWLPTTGTLNVLIVYAEAVNDPNYNSYPNNDWLPGQLPKQPEKYFDTMNSTSLNGYVTGYFNQASFGALRLNSMYWPELIQMDYGTAAYHNMKNIVAAINEGKEKSKKIISNLSSFDRLTPKSGFQPKVFQPDSMIDIVVVIWRVNTHISTQNNTGYCAPYNQFINVLGMKGINCFSEFQSFDNAAYITLRHELSHALLGGNNFHTAGAGAGTHTFIPSVGGYSMLNSWDCISNGFNSWDRSRLGWKNPEKKFVTSAYKKSANGLVEQSFDQNQQPTFANGTYLIRDFNTSGDAISLRLPGPDSPRLHQYLWLEYHPDSGRYDISVSSRSGVYVHAQVGKDDARNPYSNSSSSPGNYIFPLPASGRWDFEYYNDSTGKTIIKKNYTKSNPISGNHYLMRPVIDLNNNGTLDDKMINPEILIDGDKRPVQHYVDFGNDDDAFKRSTQTRLSVSTNPSTNTLITYNFPQHRKTVYDSDTSFITGLEINIRDTIAAINSITESCALVDVKWNQYNIDQNVRWCGTIALKTFNAKPKLTIDSGCVLLLDRSLTPMQDKVNKTDTLNSQIYFSQLTTFTLYSGTQLIVKKNATLKLSGNSTLYVRKGAKLIFEDGSKLEADNGSIVYLP